MSYKKTVVFHSRRGSVDDNVFRLIYDEFYGNKEEFSSGDDPEAYCLATVISSSRDICHMYNVANPEAFITQLRLEVDFGTEENYNSMMNTKKESAQE